VNYISCGVQSFIDNTKGKQVLCFGGGGYFQVMCCDMSDRYPKMKLVGVLDNDKNKCGKTITSAGFTTEIFSIEKALNEIDLSKTVIVITTAQLNAVKQQLESIDKLDKTDVYSYFDLKKNSAVPLEELRKNTEEPLIPKVIHYCWFGGNEIPERLQKCIDSWKRFCPDYEIKRWDESNYDIEKNDFLKKAYEAKRWAFISDYARIDIVYNEGGIYFDTDVEIIKSIDILRYNECFFGTEIIGSINSGSGFGAVKQFPVIKTIRDIYEKQFYLFTPNIEKETLYFYNKGYKPNGKTQIINGVTIFPHYVLCNKAFETGEVFSNGATVAVHYMDGSWR